MERQLKQFTNCRILRDHKIIEEDLWVRDGKIEDPEKIFFDEKIISDIKIDCKGCIIAPGFIELQINGGYGYDFSFTDKIEEALQVVSKELLSHGVTSFCPTLVTSPTEIYHKVLPKLKFKQGGEHGATILGAHVEGPYINVEKKGAHPEECILTCGTDISELRETYGSLDNIRIITLAPELLKSCKIIQSLAEENIIVSLGHSMSNLSQGEDAIRNGAVLVTHLFNAMLPFHHRDPGLVGLLTSIKIPKTAYYGLISDGIHTHPAALRIAYRVHPDGLVLVTDAISALGLKDGDYTIGQMKVQVTENKAFIANTSTLCGSTTTMIECIRILKEETGCSMEFALEAASLHPAKAMNIEKIKGTLDYGAEADFTILNDDLEIQSTWIFGDCVYDNSK